MLRYYLHDGPSALRFKLSGSLAGDEVAEIEQCWRTALSTLGSRSFLVDVSELSGADSAGLALIELWGRNEARFVAESEESRLFVESIVGHVLPFAPASTIGQNSRLRLRLAALPALIALGLLLPATVWAVDENALSPKSVLSRYIATAEKSSVKVDRETVVVDIQAELPKLAGQGRLEASESEGDRMVRQQVIERYLSAVTLAVIPANYKFHFLGAIGSAPTLTYVFRITPRRKKVGLMQGELWIDVTTGLAVHQAGRLVKSPSALLRRIDFIQDTDIREGAPYLRITRLAFETRLVGRADMTASATMPSAPLGQ